MFLVFLEYFNKDLMANLPLFIVEVTFFNRSVCVSVCLSACLSLNSLEKSLIPHAYNYIN